MTLESKLQALVAELKPLLEKATARPWEANHYGFDFSKWVIEYRNHPRFPNAKPTIAAMNGPCMIYENAEADAALIVAAVNAVSQLEALLAERQEPPVLAVERPSQKSQREASDAAEKADCGKALLALAGWYPTPVEGYGFNTSWAISDLCRAIYQLRDAAPSSGTGERK